MLKKLFILLALLQGSAVMAQRNGKPAAGGGRALTLKDSLQIKEWFFSAISAKAINNYQQSSDYFNKILEVDPANDAVLYEIANIYHLAGRESEAENLGKKAVTANPQNEWYWILLADIYKKTNNVAQLSTVLDELIRIAPEKDDYYYDKASALYLLDKTDAALDVYAAIEKKFGASEDLVTARQKIYQKQGKTDKAAGELQKIADSNPKDVRSLIELSQVYIKAGDKAKGLDALLKAKATDPGNALVQLSLADLYRGQGKTEEAFVELKSAFSNPEMDIDSKVRIVLSFFPQFEDAKARKQADELALTMTKVHASDPKAYSVYGDVLFQEEKYTEARASYKKALELNNQVYLIWEQLLRIETTQRDFEAAVKDGEEALTIFPNQGNLYLYTGIAYAQKKNHEKAISYLKNAASLQAEDKESLSQIYSSLGDSYNSLKRYKESDQAYDQAIKANPDNASTLNNYAYYLSLRGEGLDKAEQMARKANELDKNNPSYEDSYAWVLFRQKKYKDARIWIEKAIADDKVGNGDIIEHYGDILFMLNDVEQAVKQWTIAKGKGVQSVSLQRKINEKKYSE